MCWMSAQPTLDGILYKYAKYGISRHVACNRVSFFCFHIYIGKIVVSNIYLYTYLYFYLVPLYTDDGCGSSNYIATVVPWLVNVEKLAFQPRQITSENPHPSSPIPQSQLFTIFNTPFLPIFEHFWGLRLDHSLLTCLLACLARSAR